jgi:dipeptidyl aminopeptidase/acylaminoacyl peptidase
MSRVALFVLAVSGLLVATLPAAELPPLIPRKVLFGNPVKQSPQLSPDGKRLAYLAPDDRDVLQVWVQTIGKDDARKVTNDRKRGIRVHLWTYHPDTLLYAQDRDGDENFHVYAVNVASSAVRDLTPHEGVRATPIGVDRDYPDQLLVQMNRNNPRLFDAYRIDLASGKATLDTKNPGDVVGWEADAQFRIRGCQAFTRDGGVEVRYREDEKSSWKVAVKWSQDDNEGRVVGFSADGKSLWLNSSAGRDTLSLVNHDLASGKEEVLASDPHSDVSQVLFDPLRHLPEAVAFNRQRIRWQALEESIKDDLEQLRKGAPGEPSIISRDRDLKKMVVSYTADVRPAEYYLYDRDSKQLTHLFASRPDLARYTLAPMKPVVIPSRDGLELVSYLTLPVGLEPRKLPMVLVVHGGPWARDSWGFDANAQWLANRGYAVLAVNYRGSTGFGKKFLHAGDRQWATRMHDDLLDAVHWAIDKGYADPKRVAIFGGSYGGYAALVGAAFTPDVFACAVDVVGPSNLVTLLRSIPPYWEPMRKLFATRVGDPDTEKEFLESRSPLFKADQIRIPLLIAQGKNDPRVKQRESEQIVAAVKKAGKPVEYLLFPDEGHGFARPENRLKFCAHAEAFLARHLGGGRVEPSTPEPEKK